MNSILVPKTLEKHGRHLQGLFFERRACEHTFMRVTKNSRRLRFAIFFAEMCYVIAAAAGALSFTRRFMSVDADKWKGNLWPKKRH